MNSDLLSSLFTMLFMMLLLFLFPLEVVVLPPIAASSSSELGGASGISGVLSLTSGSLVTTPA